MARAGILQRVAAAACLLVLAACSGSGGSGGGGDSSGGGGDSSGGGTPALKVFDADAQVLKPYTWFFSDFDNTEAGFQQQLDYGDPFRVTTLLIKDWLERRDVATTRARVDKVVERWNLLDPASRLDYKFAYGRLPVGWWSGMDSWSFPMLLVGLWQDTGDDSYKQLADRLIADARRDVTAGGTVWRNGDECWFSEYAWEGMTPADEFYVLNGHLYALQAVRMIADALQDAELAALYDCGVRGTKSRSARFRVQDKWALYMLGPETINQTHYVIFETMQFDALHRLDADAFYSDEAAARRALLQRYFPVYIRPTSGGNRLFVSVIGPPHPYSVDTYALQLRCRDQRQTIDFALVHPTDTQRDVADRAFLDVPTDLDPASTSCTVDSEYVGQTHRLYEAAVRVPSAPASSGEDLPFQREAILDAVLRGNGDVEIDPARQASAPGDPPTYLDTQGRLILTPTVPVAWTADELLGFEFDADGELAVGVTITSGGIDYFRYYPRTRAGTRNLVLLSPLGFDGGEAITSVDRVTLFFYTDQQTRTVVLTPRALTLFRDQIELYEYLRATGAYLYTE